MALRYEPRPAEGPIRQGEFLGPLWEHQSTEPPVERQQGHQLSFASIRHSLMLVTSQDCDLLWDFQARFETDEARKALDPETADIDACPPCVPHVILCDAYLAEELRPRVAGNDIWRRIQRNQDERYHRLPAAPIGQALDENGQQPELPDVFLDFKKALALPTRQLYAGIRSGDLHRGPVIPPIYVHDVMHRFYGYHSRVALPEP